MSDERKKQLPVLIALSALLVLAVLYSVKKSMSVSAQKTAVAVEQQEETSQPLATADSADTEAELERLAEYRFVGNPPRDPFEAQIADSSTPKTPAPVPQSPPSQATARKPWNNKSPKLAGLLQPFALGPNLAVEAPGAVGAVQPDKPPFSVTGVIRGQDSMAILRGEGGGRYFVRRGQPVGDGYIVDTISPEGVALRKNNSRRFIKLGGSQDATTTTKPRGAGE